MPVSKAVLALEPMNDLHVRHAFFVVLLHSSAKQPPGLEPGTKGLGFFMGSLFQSDGAQMLVPLRTVSFGED